MFWKFHCFVREISAHIDNKTQENWRLKLNIKFVAGFAPIVTDLGESKFFTKNCLASRSNMKGRATTRRRVNWKVSSTSDFGRFWTLLGACSIKASGRPMFRFLKEQSNSTSRMWLKRFPK